MRVAAGSDSSKAWIDIWYWEFADDNVPYAHGGGSAQCRVEYSLTSADWHPRQGISAVSHHSRLLRWLTLVIAAATLATAAHAAPRNILLLIADDFGIDSAEFYPTTIRRVTTPSAPPMPNLKRLARSGVLFRTAWANPICAPSRATIFTGRYSFRTGVGGIPMTIQNLQSCRKTSSFCPRRSGHDRRWATYWRISASGT